MSIDIDLLFLIRQFFDEENFQNTIHARHHSVSAYGDVMSSGRRLTNEIKVLIEGNPQFHRKLKIPEIERLRLRHLLNQSLNWQHGRCTNLELEPRTNTLFFDHQCLAGKSNEQIPLPFQTILASKSSLVGKSIGPLFSMPGSRVSSSAINIGNQNNPAVNLEGISDATRRICSRINLDKLDAHLGGVNDLAFSSPYEGLLVITCGEDKLIQAKPCVFFNKEGTLLAVFADNCMIKILVNEVGSQLLQPSTHSFIDSMRYHLESLQKVNN
ncbi:hypothetical protein ACH5RR_039988 [Cinchona calisaya]|uniref:TOPLESS zinc finger domain-containing protein n=1 Tax=Cinchona calisaya TaxID=153742 RepID=A0ABD2Y3X9_9GENT